MYNNVKNSQSFKNKIFNLMQQQSLSKIIHMTQKIMKNSPPHLKKVQKNNFQMSQEIKLNCPQNKKQKNLKQVKNKSLILKNSPKKELFTKTSNFKHNSQTIKKRKNKYQQTQNKSYLLQTLRKMQSIKKDLSKTFENHYINNSTERYKKQSKSKKKNNKSYQNLNFSQSLKFSNKKKLSTSFSKDLILQDSSAKKLVQKRKCSSSSKKSSNLQYTQTNKAIKSLRKHLIQPNSFIKILKTQYLTIYYRVVGKNLIQLQIHIQKIIDQLWLKLFKGNLECQMVNEQYKKLRKKEIITLLSSVRSINLQQDLFHFPKLLVQIKTQKQRNLEQQTLHENQQKQSFQVTLPFCWFMMIQNVENKIKTNKIQNTRIKNKTVIENIQYDKNLLKYLNMFQLYEKKHNKSILFSYFLFQKNLYKLEINLKKTNSADLVLQGKNQKNMQCLLIFIQTLIEKAKPVN